MALINCSECDKQISDKAPHCVHCGAPLASSSEEIDLGLAEKGCSGWVTSYSDTTRSGFIQNTKTGQSIQFDHTNLDESLPDYDLNGLTVDFDVAPDGKPEKIRRKPQHKIYNTGPVGFSKSSISNKEKKDLVDRGSEANTLMESLTLSSVVASLGITVFLFSLECNPSRGGFCIGDFPGIAFLFLGITVISLLVFISNKQ